MERRGPGNLGIDLELFFGHQVHLLEILCDLVQPAIAIFDHEFRLRVCNPTWVELIERYTPSSASQVVPGTWLFDLAPGTDVYLGQILKRVLAGETVQLKEFRSESGGIISYQDAVLTPLIEDSKVVGFVDVAIDTTRHVLARQELERQVFDRTRELSALRDVMAAVSESLHLETILKRSLARVLEAMESNTGAVHLLDEAGGLLRLVASLGIGTDVMASIDNVPIDVGLAGSAVDSGEPIVVPMLGQSPRPLLALPASSAQAYVGVPIRARGRVLGVLSVIGDEGRQFTPEEIALLSSITDQVGAAVENARLHLQAEQLAVIRERERLARELHDSVTQSVYSLTLMAEAGRRLAGAGDLQRAERAFERLGEIGQQALKEMRLLVYELRPLALRREGLAKALQQRLDAVERRAGVDAKLKVEGPIVVSPSVEEGLFRITQEALNNALKHAAATSVLVALCSRSDQIEMKVTDNGTGFDPSAVADSGGVGLVSMRERAEKIGGSLQIISSPGEGTTIRVCVRSEADR
jgi:signal transduction histidine kinase